MHPSLHSTLRVNPCALPNTRSPPHHPSSLQAHLHTHVRADGRLVLACEGHDDLLLAEAAPGIVLSPGQDYGGQERVPCARGSSSRAAAPWLTLPPHTVAGTKSVVGSLRPGGSGSRLETILWDSSITAEHVSDEQYVALLWTSWSPSSAFYTM